LPKAPHSLVTWRFRAFHYDRDEISIEMNAAGNARRSRKDIMNLHQSQEGSRKTGNPFSTVMVSNSGMSFTASISKNNFKTRNGSIPQPDDPVLYNAKIKRTIARFFFAYHAFSF